MINSWMPHGFCINWNPTLLASFVLSDSLIALSYFAIGTLLWVVVYKHKRNNLVSQYTPFLYLFALFIFSCGITHVLSIISLWVPIYTIESYAKLFTSIVSLTAAAVIVKAFISNSKG